MSAGPYVWQRVVRSSGGVLGVGPLSARAAPHLSAGSARSWVTITPSFLSMPALLVSLLSLVGRVGPVGCRESLRPKNPLSVKCGHVGKLDRSGRVLGQVKWPLISLPLTLTFCR